MHTLEALQARKSIRGYLSTAVEEEKLLTVLQYGNRAPNAGPFHMTVIRSRALLDTLDAATRAAVESGGTDFLRQRFAIPGYTATYGAPVLVLLSAPAAGYGAVNCACAVTNMAIAAAELGLGTCYLASILTAFRADPALAKTLGVPDGFVPQCGMCLGYASETQIPGRPRPEEPGNITFLD